MGYKSQETLGNLKGEARINENKSFNDIWGKTQNLLNEVASEDLELKSVAKQIFSILKKHGLKPKYRTGDVDFSSAKGDGYGGVISIKDNILSVGVYDRGLLKTLKELDMGAVSYPSDEEQKEIKQKASEIYDEIVQTLGKDSFEFRSEPNPNEYGYYIIQIRKKQ